MKTALIWGLLKAIFVVVFNVFFFLSDIEPRNATVWIAYAFIHISYFMLILTPHFITRSKSAHVFGMTLSVLSATYFVMAFMTGIFFITMRFENWKISFFTQLLLAGCYIILLFTNMLADRHTAAIENRSAEEILYLKTGTSQLLALMKETNDLQKKKRIEKVYDAMRSSPTRSHPSVSGIEKKIQDEIQRLGMFTNEDENFAKHLTMLHGLIDQRSRELKLMV